MGDLKISNAASRAICVPHHGIKLPNQGINIWTSFQGLYFFVSDFIEWEPDWAIVYVIVMS